jgi:hypothetical protein
MTNKGLERNHQELAAIEKVVFFDFVVGEIHRIPKFVAEDWPIDSDALNTSLDSG